MGPIVQEILTNHYQLSQIYDEQQNSMSVFVEVDMEFYFSLPPIQQFLLEVSKLVEFGDEP